MPKYPNFAQRTKEISGSVFEKPGRMKPELDPIALHVGDCHLPPLYKIPVDSTWLNDHPGFNRYCDTFGEPTLREALLQKLSEDNGFELELDNVMTTAGACHALSISMQALVDPGDEVLLLSPYWPFIKGMAKLAGAKVCEAPLYTKLYREPELDIADYLENFVSQRTAVLYLNSPNNPSGKVLSAEQLKKVADFCAKHKLWLLSDEAYEGMTFDGHEHYSVGSFDGVFDRCISTFSFSKVYMFSGLRLGYAVAPAEILQQMNKIAVHHIYGPSTILQQMMVEPVRNRKEWMSDFIEATGKLRLLVAEQLPFEVDLPEGAYYFFLPLESVLKGRSPDRLMEELYQGGVNVTPGACFGEGFENYARICYTGVPPEQVDQALQRMQKLLST